MRVERKLIFILPILFSALCAVMLFEPQCAQAAKAASSAASPSAAADVVEVPPAEADPDEFFDTSHIEQDRPAPPPMAEYDALPRGLLLSGEAPKGNVNSGLALPTDSTSPEDDGSGEFSYQKMHENNTRVLTIEEILPLYNQGKYDKIVSSLETLAANNYPPGLELLGIMYEMGQGVTPDLAKAVDLLSKAAENNRPLAQHHLAVLYYQGKGVTADKLRALMWLDIAIVHYNKGPEKARALQDRINLMTGMSRRDAESARYMARDWLNKKGEAHLLDMEENDATPPIAPQAETPQQAAPQ